MRAGVLGAAANTTPLDTTLLLWLLALGTGAGVT